MSEFRISHCFRRFLRRPISGKQKPVLIPGRLRSKKSRVGAAALHTIWLAVALLAIVATAGTPNSGDSLVAQGNTGGLVRPYDLYDPRFCYLTPRPFLCEQCLKADQQFVQRIHFEGDGRPVRTYACRPYNRKYLD